MQVIIGWKERLDLPDWGIFNLPAKIDTGARTSAIHVARLEHLGEGAIRFEVVLKERPVKKTIWVEGLQTRSSKVKPSSGVRQERTVATTRMVLGGVERQIEISLVSRKNMLCRMLVGRTALSDFLVDPSKKYLSAKPRPKGKKKKQ